MTAQEARARWVANNSEKALQSNRDAKDRLKKRINKYKADFGCADCGNCDPRVLDLHHRDRAEKVESVNVMRVRASTADVMKEAAKCDVLCANCHRIRHAEESIMADIQITTGAFFRAT